MRILLTGATGFVGKHLVNALLDEGHYLVCAGRKRETGTNANAHLSFMHADFSKDTSKSVWLARLKGIDVVINAVGIFRETASQPFETLHAAAPRALFAACAESDVRMVIQLSALGADRFATTRYHLSKKAADDFLMRLPLRAYILQPSLIFGKDGRSARLFKTLASMPFCIQFGRAPQLIQPIHVDDVVSATVGLIRQPLPVAASGATVQRIALVGPDALSFIGYLAALRTAMGLGKIHVLRLPARVAHRIAKLSKFLPGSMLDEDTLQTLERGNTADPALTARLIGHAPRPVSEFIADPAAERVQAKLTWLAPVLRLAIAVTWIAAAIVSLGLYPVEESLRLLARTGVDAQFAPAMLYGAAVLDLAIGLAIVFLSRRRWLWLAQMALIGFYSALIAWKLPEFLLHPFGPVTKNLPMLAAIWLLFELEH